MSALVLKVGDRVKLVGPRWDGYAGGARVVHVGDVVTVDEVSRGGWSYSNDAGQLATSGGGMFEGYAIELVDEQVDPAQALFEVQEHFALMASALGGMVSQLVSQGFTPEDARTLVVHLITSNKNQE